VEAVGELDKYDARIVEHGKEHLAEVLGLLENRLALELLLVLVALSLVLVCIPLWAHLRYRSELGNALYKVRDSLPELFLDVVTGETRILDGIVEESRLQGFEIEVHLGEDHRNGDRVPQV
jgi:hypothetical protein